MTSLNGSRVTSPRLNALTYLFLKHPFHLRCLGLLQQLLAQLSDSLLNLPI